MSKFLAIGLSLPQVIACVTDHAANGLRLAKKGRLAVGFDADLTIFDLRRQPVLFTDVENSVLQADQLLTPLAAIRAGRGYLTEQGRAEHVFDL